MKKIAMLIAGLGIAAAAIPATANAQTTRWQNINQRQAQIEQRIDVSFQRGVISRREAVSLRSEFRQLSLLEARYRQTRPGLTLAERRDLDRRFDLLSRKVRLERRDNNRRAR